MNSVSDLRRAAVCALSLLLMIGLSADAAWAQHDPRGLSFVAGAAYEWGGPGPSLVRELAAAGLDQDKPEECFGTTCVYGEEYPFYFDEGLNLAGMFGLRYRFDPPFSIEALVSNSLRGQAEGYNQEVGDHLVVTYSSILFSTTLAAHLGPVRLEAGPLWNRTRWGKTRTRSSSASGTTVTLGAVLSASASRVVGRAMVSVKAGLRENPPVDLRGPLQVELEPGYRTFFLGATVAPLLY